MSDQLVNELFKSPVVVGIAVVVCIVIIVMIFRSRSEYYSDDEHVKETFQLDTIQDKGGDVISTFINLPPLGTFEEVTHSGDIIENFPSAEMNVMYSDANGNLATTTDLGLKNLTVSGDSQFGDGKIGIKNGGTIYAPGRMHVHGEELLYLLHKNGVIIGKEWGGNGNLNVQGRLAVNGYLDVDGQIWTKNRLSACTEDPWGGAHTGLLVNKGAGGWNTLIHNPNNGSNVHIANGDGYGMHINGGSNNKNTDKYILQCWNGEREVLNVNGKGNTWVSNNLAVGGQTNMDRLVVGGDLGGHFTGMSINKGSGDWNTMIHNPNSSASVYMAHGAKYGMHINANNKDMDTYALQLYGGDKHLMQVNGRGNMYVAGQTDMNRLVVGEDMGGEYQGMSMKKHADGWMVRMDNAKNNANVHMCHGGGYGMHINAQNNGSGNYILECHNGAKAVLTARGNGNVDISDTLTANRLVIGGDSWGNGHGLGLMVRKADSGWQSLIHNIHNESNVHMAHGEGYGMHINGGSNCKNTDKYVLQCWNGEREVLNVNGHGNTSVSNNLSVGGNISEKRNRARWIRIGNMDQRFQQKYWSLLEVEVYNYDNVNVARGKPVSIISGGPDPGVHDWAKDPNQITNGKIADASGDGASLNDDYYQGYHGNVGFENILQIDLGAEYTIGQIVVYNRRGATDRLNGTVIQLFDKDGVTVNRTINTGIWGNVFSKEYCL